MDSKQLNFTLVDIKPSALAKFVLVFDLLYRYMLMRFAKIQGAADALVVVSYLTTCQIIPSFVQEKLYDHLNRLIETMEQLEADQKPDHYDVFEFFCMPPSARREILKIFKQWKQPVSPFYYTSRIRPNVREYVKTKRTQLGAAFGSDTEKAASNKDRKDFDTIGCLFADMDFFKRREPQLASLYEAGPSKHKELEEYIDAKWSINTTLLDADHEATISEDLEKDRKPLRFWLQTMD